MHRLAIVLTTAALASTAAAERFYLITGIDARLYPGQNRTVPPVPGPGVPGTFNDGDRLAGTSDRGPTVNFVGVPPAPMFQPNEFGSLSFLFRRGSVPLGPSGRLPFMGIEFLGGPLLDLDGDPSDSSRSLVPVPGRQPAVIPGTQSFVDLSVSDGRDLLTLHAADITGTNEGGPGVSGAIATILVTLAGTSTSGQPGPAINPAVDTRSGALSAFAGTSGTLTGVYRISNLGYELWEDTVDPASSTASVLGTMQFLGAWRGWLIERDDQGAWPALAGQGLGSTLWPTVNTAAAGQTFATASGLAGGSATITLGPSTDRYDAPGNGGLPLSDFGGDLGAYLDGVVIPRLSATATRLVYLEAAGWGINNSNDPVFTDTVSYDSVIIAAADACRGGRPCDSNCDGQVNFDDIDCFVAALAGAPAWHACGAVAACDYLCANDVNRSGGVDFDDIDAFVACLAR